MFIDISDCEKMFLMVSLIWCCVKVIVLVLEDINEIMLKL